jgi:hypothetical protein
MLVNWVLVLGDKDGESVLVTSWIQNLEDLLDYCEPVILYNQLINLPKIHIIIIIIIIIQEKQELVLDPKTQ